MKASDFAIFQILIENNCCLIIVYDLIMTASRTEMRRLSFRFRTCSSTIHFF